jgi:peptidyl-prolyl cis-trans isomerase C
MIQSPITRWSALAAATVVMAACGKGQQAAAPAPAADAAPAAPAVATVNGVQLSRPEYDFYMRSLLNGKPPTELTAEQKSQILDELINTDLVAQQAVKDGLEKDPQVVAGLDVARMRLLFDAETQKVLKGKEPTDQELHTEYDTAVAAADKTEYRARHILVASKDQADQVIKRLKGGAKFEDVAKAQSIDNSKTSGGELGWFTTARMVKPFGDAVKGLKKGEITPEPVQTQFGWHVIQLEDTRPVSLPPFDQVKQQLANHIMQKKLQAYVDELKKNAKIEKKL